MARKNNTAERKSTVKGIWANATTQEFNQFEIETEYTRSIEKAVKLASAIINPDNRPEIMVSVSEIVNEKAQRKVWNNTALYLEAREMCMTEAEALEMNDANELVIKGCLYNFETQIWAYNPITEEYVTKPFSWTTGANVTAKDARAMLAMRFEEMHKGFKVLGLNHWTTSKGYTKAQDDVWFVINEIIARERCIKEASESDES